MHFCSLGMVFVSVTDSADLHHQNEDLVDAARNMGLLQQDQQNIQRYLPTLEVTISGSIYTPHVARILIIMYVHGFKGV